MQIDLYDSNLTNLDYTVSSWWPDKTSGMSAIKQPAIMYTWKTMKESQVL